MKRARDLPICAQSSERGTLATAMQQLLCTATCDNVTGMPDAHLSPCGARCRSHGGLLLFGRPPNDGPSMALAGAWVGGSSALLRFRCWAARGASEGSLATASRTSSSKAPGMGSTSVSAAVSVPTAAAQTARPRRRLGWHGADGRGMEEADAVAVPPRFGNGRCRAAECMAAPIGAALQGV